MLKFEFSGTVHEMTSLNHDVCASLVGPTFAKGEELFVTPVEEIDGGDYGFILYVGPDNGKEVVFRAPVRKDG